MSRPHHPPTFTRLLLLLALLFVPLFGLAARPAHAAATSGTIVTWGTYDDGPEDVPPPVGLTGIISFDAFDYHTVALKSDGTVVGWGENNHGQVTDVPATLTDVVAVAAGGYHTLALKSDGTVVGWGENNYGQVTDVPIDLADVVAISAGRYYSVALQRNGSVRIWGQITEYNQLQVPDGLTDVVAIDANEFHVVALKSDGTIVVWGRNMEGQMDVPAGLTDVVAVAAGRKHTVVLKRDGTVLAWGSPSYGEADVPDGLTGVVAIAAGTHHTLAILDDGAVVAWGKSDSGELDVPDGLTGAIQVGGGFGYSVALGVSDAAAPTFGACPQAGPFILGSGAQSIGPIAATDEAGGSGVNMGASTLTGTVDTRTVGTKTVTFTAVDNAHNEATTTCSYQVIYKWAGFLQPIDNLPTINTVNAGRAIPITFSLGGNQGVNIFAPGYPVSQPIACSTGAPTDEIEQTVTAGSSSLTYDAASGQYSYTWKTSKSWAGTCRQLVVRLADGTDHVATFKFK